jgi:transposase-like protein
MTPCPVCKGEGRLDKQRITSLLNATCKSCGWHYTVEFRVRCARCLQDFNLPHLAMLDTGWHCAACMDAIVGLAEEDDA